MAEKRSLEEIFARAGGDVQQQSQTQPQQEGETGFRGFAVGAAKGVLETAQGLGQLVSRGAEIVTGQEKGKFGSQETFFEDPTRLDPKSTAEQVGKFAERVGEFVVPTTKVIKATEGANFLIRLGSRILSSASVATAQTGEIGKETAIAGGIEAAFPIGGAVLRVIRRLFKGLSSGLSGAATNVIDAIVENPQVAIRVSREIEKSGNFSILETNARIIVEGVARVRQEARRAFGAGLEKLKEIDISPKAFRSGIQPVLDKFGSIIEKGKRILKNVEFSEKINLDKANALIDRLSRVKLDGKSLRKLADDIEASKYTVARSDERLSFNVFIDDLSKGLKNAINNSTDKLQEINKAFSLDMQLVEGIERILGKVKFKSLSEIDKVAKKLEGLFAQKGIDPQRVDDFLRRIDVDRADFRTAEATRRISAKSSGATSVGLSFAEITRQITSAVLTPEAIRNAAIITGISVQVLKPILEAVAPAARGALIELLIDEKR